MSDRVESTLEKMVDEFAYYRDESLFSQKEITQIVKQRKLNEFAMCRKDADISFFLDAVKYEIELEKTKAKRVRKQLKL